MEPAPHKLPIRFYEIDLLRFVAAISVVIYHYTFIGATRSNYNPLVFPEFAPITKYGYLGVELFFIISGYVVLLSAQGKTVRQFFVSRVTRLYPAYWVACTLTFLVKIVWGAGTNASLPMTDDLGAGPMQYVYNMTMLQSFIGIRNMDGPYWSLAVEITFYFLISLLIGYYLLRYVDWFLLLWLGYVALPKLAYGGTLFCRTVFSGLCPLFHCGDVVLSDATAEGPYPVSLCAIGCRLLTCDESLRGQCKNTLNYLSHVHESDGNSCYHYGFFRSFWSYRHP